MRLPIAITLIATAFIVISILLFLKKRGFSYISLAIAAIHALLVVYMGISTELNMQTGTGESLLGWLLFDVIDMPVSLFILLFSDTIDVFLHREILLPIYGFGIFGTIQYLFFSEAIIRLYKRSKENIRTKKSTLSSEGAPSDER